MKTVFKVGMKVYDQVNFPDKEGKVEEIYIGEEEEYPIVSFGKRERICYSSDGRLSGRITKMLSTKPYKVEFQGFEQKSHAPEFYEALEWLDNNKNYQTVFEDERTYPSKEIYEAFEALRKLIILRDYYNEGWQPDWSTKNSMHFCIRVRNNKITIDSNSDINEFNTVLVFRDYTIRDKFLEEQRELLEIAKPLL